MYTSCKGLEHFKNMKSLTKINTLRIGVMVIVYHT
jgi:hypothetical protein